MKKVLFVLVGVMGIVFWFSNQTVQAAESFTYDTKKGGKQSGYVDNADGETLLLTVEEIQDDLIQHSERTQFNTLASLQNKTYSIKGSSGLTWSARYNIRVYNSIITKATDSHVSSSIGKVYYKNLRVPSTKKAVLDFKIDRWIGDNRSAQLISTIFGDKINISQN